MSSDCTSTLSYLGFQRVEPSQYLTPYVLCYWKIERTESLLGWQHEFLYPDGGMGLILNFGDTHNIGDQLCGEAYYIDGTNTVARKLSLRGKINAIGIRFLPGGAAPFLDPPLFELRNQVCNLDGIVPPSIRPLYEMLGDCMHFPRQIELIENWLHRRLICESEAPRWITWSIDKLQKSHGNLEISKLTAELGISQRMLERYYRQYVGMTPKFLARILRVEKSRAMLKMDKIKSYSYIGQAAGFYDQSHFNRDFKSITGFTPKLYRLKPRHKQ